MGQRPGEFFDMRQVSISGRLWAAVAILAVQILANGFVGLVIINGLNQDASYGVPDSNAGLGYTIGYVSLALALVLLVCVVCTFRPQAWARPTIVIVEVIAIINGVINLFNGVAVGAIGLVFAVVVISLLNNDGDRDWYQRGRGRP